jgi:hypothetical protein
VSTVPDILSLPAIAILEIPWPFLEQRRVKSSGHPDVLRPEDVCTETH